MGTKYVDGSYVSFNEEVAGVLDNKENFLVELAADGGVQLFSGAGASVEIGTMFEKLKLGDPQVTIRVLGKGGTMKVIQNAAVAIGARVKAQNGGKVITAGGGDRSIGIKIGPISGGAGAAGDVIEIIDLVEKI